MFKLTDDAIDSFVYNLSDYLGKRYPDGDIFEKDPEYEMLRDFVFAQLDKYSNGYRNYN